MQNSSAAKPLLVVTIGPPGAGKSFFAKRFAETFGAPLVSFDEIRYELFNDITHSDDENIIVARVAGMQLRELLITKKTIIIDGGHNPKVSRTELAKVAKSAGYTTLYVWVQADERTARERSTHRSSRRDDDRLNRSLTEDEFEAQARRFTPPSQYEAFVVVSGRHTYPTQAKAVLKKMIRPDTVKEEPVKPKVDARGTRRIISL